MVKIIISLTYKYFFCVFHMLCILLLCILFCAKNYIADESIYYLFFFILHFIIVFSKCSVCATLFGQCFI